MAPSARPGGAEEAGETAAAVAGLAADSRTVAGWVLLSRITGFGRVAAIAAVLGPTYFGNLFQASALLPSTIYGLLAGSLISALLVPPLVHRLDQQDRAGACRLASGFLGIALSVFVAVAGSMMIAAPLITEALTLTVDDPLVRHLQMELGGPLLVMLAPQIVLYGIAGAGVAVQHAHGRFALAAAAPVLENVGIIAVMGASGALFGFGNDVGEVTTTQLLVLGIGTTAAVGLHAAVQWWGAWRAGIPLLPQAGWRDPEIRRILRMGVPSCGYASLYWVVFLGLLVVAGSVPGGVAALQIGYALFQLPIALSASPLAAAQLPRLARSFSRGMGKEFHHTYRSSLAIAIFVTLPAGLLFVAVPQTLAQAVAFGEMATITGIALVAACIGGLGLGVVGEAGLVVSTSASFARRDAWAPCRAMSVRLVIAVSGMVIARGAEDDVAMLWILALTLSAANLCAAAYLHWSQVRALPVIRRPEARQRLGDVVVAMVSIAPAIWMVGSHATPAGEVHVAIGVAVATIGGSAILYLAIQWLRGSAELDVIVGSFLGPAAGGVGALATTSQGTEGRAAGLGVAEVDLGLGPPPDADASPLATTPEVGPGEPISGVVPR